nr:PLP-dependent aminotransferase family protein [Pedobacter panaciterrae]
MDKKPFNWIIPDLDRQQPRSQTEKFIVENIKSRYLIPGAPLLSYRQFAELNGVSEGTVKRAYSNLIMQGWLSTKPGGGTFVSQIIPGDEMPIRASGFTDRFPAGLEIPKQTHQHIPQPFVAVGTYAPAQTLFPHEIFNKYYSTHNSRDANLSQAELLSSYKGEHLRHAILTDLNHKRGFGIKAEMLEIIKDRKPSLERVFEILLSKPGEVVINTSVFDLTLTNVLKECAAITHTISLQDEHFLEKIEELLKQTKVRAIYVRPQCSFPERLTLTEEQCIRLIELAKEYQTCIVEEDEDHEFYYGLTFYKPLACYDHDGYVIYLGALSMATSYTRSLRIIVASLQLINALRDLPAQSIEQREITTEKAMADMILNGDLGTYQKNLRLNAKKDRFNLDWVLSNYLGDHMSFETPEHGLMFWLKFRDEIDLNLLLNQLEDLGIKVPFHPNNQKTDSKVNYMLLGFGHYQMEEAEGAAKLLKEIIDQFLQKQN